MRYMKTRIIPAICCGMLLSPFLFAGCASAPKVTREESVTLHAAMTSEKNSATFRSDMMMSSTTDRELLIEGTVKIPGGDSNRFWSDVMTASVIANYQAQGYVTFCNRFVGDTVLKYFGREVYGKIFPNGVLDPNIMHTEWQSNPYLIRLDPKNHSILDIQGYADKGYLVLLSYTWTYGHLAFIGNQGLKIHTVPASPLINGRRGTDLDQTWLPVVVQAGVYTGVTSVGYATNGWLDGQDYPLYRNGTARFYAVRQ